MYAGIDSLSAIIRYRLRFNPYDGSIYVFRDQSGTMLKYLHWDGQSFCQGKRRAQSGTYPWPDAPEGEIVRRVFRMLVPLADKTEVRLTANLDRGCFVLSMEDDAYQIIFNLVENGIKYNHSGGCVHVTVSHTQEDVELLVEDTGMGIPQAAIEHIFERFYRVDKARSRQAGGSGLGLSIVHELVERNFGSIAVSSEEGKGTRFTVRLPYFALEEDEDDA